MPFTIENFSRVRPFLYHLTAKQNLARIQRTGRLDCAATLMRAAGDESLITRKRRTAQVVTIAGEAVHIRDQSPLHEGNITFENGWSFPQLIGDLNRRVFFWPGTPGSPISYGIRHFERYREEAPALLRLSYNELLESNPDAIPLFCKFNSGSPRCSSGRGSSRSSQTFVTAQDAGFTPSNVVEVTFLESVHLPQNVHVSDVPDGPWHQLA